MFKRKPFNPWMTEALIVSRKNKAKLFNKKLRKPSLITINKFKEYNVVEMKSGLCQYWLTPRSPETRS